MQTAALLPLLLLLPLANSWSDYDDPQRPSFTVDQDKGQFLLDGQPFRYISGSVHYFRIHPDQWLDRLQRVRALGFNAVQYYVPWNFHEVERGVYDFSGIRDFARFSTLAASEGLYTLLRFGPYACAEWENGGLPYWLLSQYEDIRMRTSDKRFLYEVKKWFRVLATEVRPLLRSNGGPVLMVQIENEYGNLGVCDATYNAFLRDSVRELLGNDTLIYTTDPPGSLKCGAVPGTLTTVDFGPTANNSVIDDYFEQQKKYLPGGKGPLVNSEFYPGWFVMWGQKTQKLPSDDAVMASVKHIWEKGASLNFYMIHGGTNFAYWNGAETTGPVITSCDYSAPISEAGDYTALYFRIRDFIAGLEGWPNRPTAPPKPTKKLTFSPVSVRHYRPVNELSLTECTTGADPVSFEKLGQQFGFVLYSTTLKQKGKNLTIAGLKDFGYVTLGGKRQKEYFIKNYWHRSVKSIELDETTDDELEKGLRLDILVENQGRQTYLTINDFKGILSPVLLDGSPLTGWMSCALHKEFLNDNDLDGLLISGNQTDYGTPGLYLGHFNVNEAGKILYLIGDTWLDMKKWGKGVVVVNDFNIGRYWSSEGPQNNLYVPAPLLKKGSNTVFIFELFGPNECTQRGCLVRFSDQPDIHFSNSTMRHFKMRPEFY